LILTQLLSIPSLDKLEIYGYINLLLTFQYNLKYIVYIPLNLFNIFQIV